MLIQEPQASYDIVVVGAGMVGGSFALAMQHAGSGFAVSMLVVEAFQHNPNNENTAPSFDDRSTALSFGSRNILQQIGVWSELADKVTAIKKIHISDRGHLGTAKLNAEQQQVDALGYVVDNRSLGQVLNKALSTSELIDFLVPATIQNIAPVAGGMELQVKVAGANDFLIKSSLVVLADGGKSPICSQLGIDTDRENYQQHALISNIAFEQPHDYVAYERFTDTGPMAILPLAQHQGENRGALIWTISDEDADTYMAMPDPEILSLLQLRFGYRLGRITKIGKRVCYPLSLSVAKEQVRPGLVLLGNVAHTLHPVAGQGFNLSLRDAKVLADVLAQALAQGESPGSMQVLQNFQSLQRNDQDRTIRFSHYLTRLFSSDRGSLVWARKFGLASIDLLPGVQQTFAKAAMGLADK